MDLVGEDENVRNESHGRLAMLELANMLSVPMALSTVFKLNVADIIWQNGLNNPLSAGQVSSKIPSLCSSQNLERIMRVLASYNIFKETVVVNSNVVSERLYSLTEVGKTLVKDEIGLSFGFYVLQHHQKALLEAWPMLHASVLDPTQEPFRRAHGKLADDFYVDDDDSNHLMRKAMASVSVPFMNTFVKSYDGFGGVGTLVDVGGSSGFCLHMIIQKHVHIRGINFDLPQVVDGVPSYQGVTNVGGNMFEFIPSGDAIFMKWVLTCWSDENCIHILKNCFKALPDGGGRVIASEPVLPKQTDNSQRTRALLVADLFILTTYVSGAKEREVEDYTNLGIAAGFSKLRTLYLDPFFSVRISEIASFG